MRTQDDDGPRLDYWSQTNLYDLPDRSIGDSVIDAVGEHPDRVSAAWYLRDYKDNWAFENLGEPRTNTRCGHRSDGDPIVVVAVWRITAGSRTHGLLRSIHHAQAEVERQARIEQLDADIAVKKAELAALEAQALEAQQ